MNLRDAEGGEFKAGGENSPDLFIDSTVGEYISDSSNGGDN